MGVSEATDLAKPEAEPPSGGEALIVCYVKYGRTSLSYKYSSFLLNFFYILALNPTDKFTKSGNPGTNDVDNENISLIA